MKKVKLTSVCRPKQWKSIPISELSDVGYPVYGANGVIGYYDSYNHEQETVIITCRGATCGTVNLTHPRSYVTGNAMCLDNVKDSVDIKYLFYSMQAYDFTKVISGTAQPQITRVGLEKVEITLPSLDVQREIVSILDKINALIEQRRLQLKKLEELVKARFVELFGDLRTNTKEWKIQAFSELTDLITDGEHATPRRTTNGIYLLSARNILNHAIQLDDVDYIDQEEYDRIAKRVVPQAGDVLISCSGTVGRCCTVPVGLKFQMVRSAALLRFKPEINPKFAEYMITSEYLQEQINRLKTASSQANLFQGKIAKLKGFAPPMELQQEFNAFVAVIDKSKATVQKALDETQLLFDSLMQQYFG